MTPDQFSQLTCKLTDIEWALNAVVVQLFLCQLIVLFLQLRKIWR